MRGVKEQEIREDIGEKEKTEGKRRAKENKKR